MAKRSRPGTAGHAPWHGDGDLRVLAGGCRARWLGGGSWSRSKSDSFQGLAGGQGQGSQILRGTISGLSVACGHGSGEDHPEASGLVGSRTSGCSLDSPSSEPVGDGKMIIDLPGVIAIRLDGLR